MTFNFRSLIAAASFILLCSITSAQGFIITDSDGSTTFIKEGWVKTVGEDGEAYSSIYNLSTGKFFLINHDEQVYAEGTMEDYCQVIKDMEDAMMANMSEEQSAMMKQFMEQQKSAGAPEIEINKMGSEKLAGFTADKYEVYVNGELYEEVWLTDDASLSEIIELGVKMEEITMNMIRCSSYANPEGEPEYSKAYMDLMKKGFELRSISYEYGNADTTSEVLSIEEDNISDSEFDPPEGFSRVSLKEMMQLQSGM